MTISRIPLILTSLFLATALPLTLLAQDTPSSPEKGSLVGTITATSGSSLIVHADDGGVYTVSTLQAKLENKDGISINLSDLKIGDRVRLNGSIAGTLSADLVRNISLETKSFEGRIEALGSGSFTLITRDLDFLTVNVSGATKYFRDDKETGFFELRAGTLVKVTGIYNPTAKTVAASEMKIRGETEARTFLGRATSEVKDGSFLLVVRGLDLKTVFVSSSTIYLKNGNTTASSDVKFGTLVRVSGMWNRLNDTITANTVEILEGTEHVILRGRITGNTGGIITISINGNGSFSVDTSRAKLVRSTGGRIKASDLKIGHTVEVKGNHATDSLFVSADAIKDLSLKKEKKEKKENKKKNKKNDD